MKKNLWLVVALLLITPIALNFFLGISHPNNISVVGDSTAWLQFYSNYLGCIIATSGSFYILYCTIKNSRHEQIAEIQHQKVVEIRKDLSIRFAEYAVAEVIRFTVCAHPNREVLRKEAVYIQGLRDKYKGLQNSAILQYSYCPLQT